MFGDKDYNYSYDSSLPNYVFYYDENFYICIIKITFY